MSSLNVEIINQDAFWVVQVIVLIIFGFEKNVENKRKHAKKWAVQKQRNLAQRGIPSGRVKCLVTIIASGGIYEPF